MEIIHDGENKFVELVKGDYFRVTTCSRVTKISPEGGLHIEDMPIGYGLAVEQKFASDVDEHYVVALFVRWDENKKEVYIENTIDDYLATVEQMVDDAADGEELLKKLMEFRNAKDFAIQALKDIYGVE